MSILVLGSSNTDLVISLPRLPGLGETVAGGNFYRCAGGKGANQAVAAARCGGHVTFVSAVGDDEFGRAALAGLKQDGIDYDLVKVVRDQPSGVALIMVDAEGENCIGVASGANNSLFPEDVAAIPLEIFSSSRVFLACLESPLATVTRGLVAARNAGLVTILNPAPATVRILQDDVLPHVDILTPNRVEAQALSDVEVSDLDSAIAAARKLQELGAGAVVLTLGADGCLVLENEPTAVPAPRVQAVDTTGAGDTFNGALAVALSEGRSLLESAAWAARAAAISVTRRGAQPSIPTRAQIDAVEFQ